MSNRPILPLPRALLEHHGQTLFEAMTEWLAQKRVPPVLLLTGTTGIGKREITHFLAQWLLCQRTGFSAAEGSSGQGGFFEEPAVDLFGGSPAETPPETTTSAQAQPCGQCAACQRALHGNWVDVTEVLPEEDSEVLKIDQLRRLKTTMGYGAHDGAFRITLIPNADRMTAQAANSVLKLLEEPPQGWIFFLTASDPTLILPTVLSRCQTLRLRPLPPSALTELLNEGGADPRRIPVVATLAQGSWRKAVALTEDEIWEKRSLLFGFLKEPHVELNRVIDWATKSVAAADNTAGSSERDPFSLFLAQLESILWDLIRWSAGSDAPENHVWANSDGASTLAEHAKRVVALAGNRNAARDFWMGRAELLAEVRQRSLAPLNRKLMVQDLLMPWLPLTQGLKR